MESEKKRDETWLEIFVSITYYLLPNYVILYLMAKRKKRRSKSFKKITTLLSRLLLIGLVLGGYYVYKNPEFIKGQVLGEEVLTESEFKSSEITLDSFVNQEKVAEILGKTTDLVEEGLETIKVPKQFTGTDEEIVLEDAFNQFSQKIKDLPEQQVDRIKVQFCKDVLESVDNASVVEKE